MNILKDGLNVLIKNPLFFLTDAIFFIITIILLVFAKIQTQNYLYLIQSYAPELESILSALQQNTQNIAEAENMLVSLTSVINKSLMFSFLLIPLIIFVVYVIFQSLNWYLILKNFGIKIRYKEYLLKFFLISVIPSVLLVLMLFLTVVYELGLQLIFLSVILVFLLFYFAFVTYVGIGFLSNITKSIIFGLRRAYFLTPLFIILISFVVVFFSVSTLAYFAITTKIYSALPSVISLLIIDLVVIEFLKVLWVMIVKNRLTEHTK